MELLPKFKIIPWKNQFVKEGESDSVAEFHAIQRCYEAGHITEEECELLWSERKAAEKKKDQEFLYWGDVMICDWERFAIGRNRNEFKS